MTARGFGRHLSPAEPAATPFDAPTPTSLRHTLGRFATGVTVLSMRDTHGELAAMTVSSFTSLSLDPPLVLLCIRREATMAPDLVRPGASFGISVLAVDQGGLARSLSRHERDLAALDVFDESPDVPVVSEAVAHLVCDLETVHPGGDHHIVVARVRGVRATTAAPLIYLDGRLGG